MQAEHIQIMKLMHDIAELSEKHNITEHEPIGNYRLKVECKSPYRFGSVVYKRTVGKRKPKSVLP